MILHRNQLINLPVVTQSGEQLGRIADFEMDTDEQSISRYIVRPGTLLAGLVQNDLIISREQVISFTATTMVVEDAVVTAKNRKELVKKAIPAT